MNICKSAAILAKLLITLFLIATPLSAQRRRPAAPKAQPPAQATEAAPTFDTVLAADSYKIYGEVRGVGQLLRSPGVNDILDPVMKLAGPPKEFKTVVKWLNSQTDALMTSRLMFAAWPSRPNLPSALFVIEFPSVEDAQKFEPRLKEFLPRLLPTPTPESPSNSKNENAEAKPGDKPPPAPPYILKQSGALIFISAEPFTLKSLRPSGSKLLAEDPNFRQVHDRLNSESVFLYFDVASVEKEERERTRQMKAAAEEKRREIETANSKKADGEPEPSVPERTPDSAPPAPEQVVVGPPQPSAVVTVSTYPQSQATLGGGNQASVIEGVAQDTEPASMTLSILSGAFIGGRPKWPEAIGVAIAVDADAYVVRALLVNGPGAKGSIIPFIPQIVSGPALTPEAPSVLPDDTELLVTLSLDYPLIYEGLLKAMTRENEATLRNTRQTMKGNQPESPFAVYEAKLGIKIKDDLLPLLGNEIALSIPVKALGMGLPQPAASSSSAPKSEEATAEKTAPPSEPTPVVAISVKDREAVRTLIPKVIETIGFKGANLLAQTEKRDDTELVSYANVISYAFIGNFLVVSPDARAVRHVVDSYLNHQTLASDSAFKNYTRWQPRQVLGQVYLSPALAEAYNELTKDVNSLMNDTLRDFLSRLSPTAEPVTYALSNEGLGPLHELHVPKNLVMLMIAGIASESKQPPVLRNEEIAKSTLRMFASAQTAYQATAGDSTFGTLDQLVEHGLVQRDLLQKSGYRFDVNVAGNKFEASAVPTQYGKTGKMSFFVNESGVLRGADHGGGPATAADKPVQ